MLKLSGFLRPYRLEVALVLVLTFAQTMSSLYLPKLMSHIVDVGILQGNVPYIVRIGVWMFAVTLLGGLAAVAASYGSAKAMAGFGQGLRLRLFGHVERFTPHEFERWGTSSLIVRTTNDVMQVQQLVSMLLRMMVMAPLMALGGILLAVTTDARLSLVLVVLLPVMGLAIYLVMGRGLGLFRVLQAKVDRLNLVLRENLTGARVIRSFGRTAYELGRFDVANRELTDTSVQVFQLMATMMPLVMLIMNLATLVVVWFGGVQINAGTLQIGRLMAFIQYVTQIMFAVMMVSMMFFMIPRGQASAQRILEVLALEPEIVDPEAPRQAGAVRGGAGAGGGEVEFRDVSFRYPGAEEPALSGVSFRSGPGETTAIIGGTGSGKSTLLNLIPRFFDVDVVEGCVLVDGVDVRDFAQKELRARIGYVPQRAVLFSGSVLENVRYGDEGASESAVRHALDVAQATEFVDDLEGGLAAEVAQGGANLSGGQRQRLAIARALVRRAGVYLFDDSFSALDYRTDARLRSALRGELGTATILVVAQRVSTIVEADRILVLDDGRLVGVGTHQELLTNCPVYQEIVASQASSGAIA